MVGNGRGLQLTSLSNYNLELHHHVRLRSVVTETVARGGPAKMVGR